MLQLLSLLLVSVIGWKAQGAELSLPLARLMSSPAPIQLRNLADEYVLSLPIPERWQVKSVRLTLDFAHSNALVASRSQLRLQVNGITIAQWRLNPDAPKRLETVSIPVELLVPGYNKLLLSVAQHYTDRECEANFSPELWTEINPFASQVELEYELKSLPLSLARLGEIFDQKLPQAEVALLFPALDLSDRQLEAGSLIAQGIGLRLDYTQFQLSLDPAEAQPGPGPIRLALVKDRDAVLLGTREQLAPYLDPEFALRITGPYLGLFAQAKAPGRIVLIVSGRTEDEVYQAALAFALMRFPLPDAQETVIADLDFGQFFPYQAQPVLAPNRTYTFEQLGFLTASRRGIAVSPWELWLYLPPDAFAPEEAQVVFLLHLAYNAGMRSDSMVEMRINGVFERAIQLPETSGAHYRDYRIQVPLRSFRPGRNRISFHPLLVPAISGECLLFQADSLEVTLYQDSQLALPAFSHYAELPDLALLAHTGFPYLESGDGSGMGVYLLDRRPDTILAAWHLIAQLARLNGLPLPKARLSSAEPSQDLDWIAVGGQLKQLPALLQSAPIALDPVKVWRYPAGFSAPAPARWWQALFAPRLGPKPLEPHQVTIGQTGGLGEHALAVSFQNRSFPGRLVTAFLAEGEKIYPAVLSLIRPELWSQMQGDLLFWRQDAKTLAWQRVGTSFYRGQADLSLRLIFHFTRYPWQWLGASLAVCILFAWLVRRMLKRFKQRHHPDAQEVAP